MKRRNFFLSLFATAFGVKAAPQLEANVSAYPLTSKEWFEMDLITSKKEPLLYTLRIKRLRVKDGQRQLRDIAHCYGANRSRERVDKVLEYYERMLRRHPDAVPASAWELRGVQAHLMSAVARYEQTVQMGLGQKHYGGMSVEDRQAAWRKQVRALIAERRHNPDAIHAMPFPLAYQDLG